MKQLTFDYTYAEPFLEVGELESLAPQVTSAHNQLHRGQGLGSDFLGWLDLPKRYARGELVRIKDTARRIQEDSEILVVVGIGGSYLGARAALGALAHSFYNLLPRQKRSTPQILFAGHTLSSSYAQDLLDVLASKDFSLNVISKSGTTIEPALAFRVLRRVLERKYGREEASRRIYVTTDQTGGILRAMAEREGYASFVIPADIGGRYSVLTPVGLLPMAVAGLDVEEMMEGARRASLWYGQPDLGENRAYQYAALRNVFYRKGKTTEILVNYEPALQYFNEWWKQLFGESEGKDQKGLFPASVSFTTDLHSLGQFIQEGTRHIFATTIWVEKALKEQVIPKEEGDPDELNYLEGQTLQSVNYRAFQGTVLAHTDGGVPNLVLEVPALTAYYFGALVYFFEKACALSGYLLGVNPFDQPGVESYKSNMFALLEKPGFAERGRELKKRWKRGGVEQR